MLDYKDSYILNLLLTSNQTLNIKDISKLIGISQRSSYYSMSRINDFLESQGFNKLVNKRSEGIVVDSEIKIKLKNTLSEHLHQFYIYTQKERNTIEILLLLCTDEYVNAAYFEDLFNVSRNTITNDIREIRRIISVYNLALEFDSNCGYVIDGSSLRKRSVILNLITSYDYLLKINHFDLFTESDVLKVHGMLTVLEKVLNIKYVNNTLISLSKLISIIKKNHIEEINWGRKDKEQLDISDEYEAVAKVFKGYLADSEMYYLTIHILGLRIHQEADFETKENDYVKEIVDFIISEFSRITLIYFENVEELFKNLYTHMKQAIFRLKYGIMYQNELKDQIYEKYPQITHVTKLICDKLEKKLGYPISDDDLTYIAMHFGGHLRREKREFPHIKVLLVCLNGIATSKILRKELEYLVGNLDIIDAISLDEVHEYQNDVDYIITTVPINNKDIKKKVLHVNAILTDIDKVNILSFMGLANLSQNENDITTRIIEDIKEYLPKDKIEEVRKIILNRINNRSTMNISKERIKRPMLKELIDENKIIFVDKVNNWEDAIILSAKPLLQDNYIEQSYINKVISNVKELGPYIVIAPKIAISHARPEAGVNRLGMSILLIKEAVKFSEEKDRDVNIVITLAAPDNEKHLLALQQLSELLMESLDELLGLKDKKSVLALINKYSKKEE